VEPLRIERPLLIEPLCDHKREQQKPRGEQHAKKEASEQETQDEETQAEELELTADEESHTLDMQA
jgi:hypothetical protein